jgi:hypothetical protein
MIEQIGGNEFWNIDSQIVRHQLSRQRMYRHMIRLPFALGDNAMGLK